MASGVSEANEAQRQRPGVRSRPYHPVMAARDFTGRQINANELSRYP